MMQQEEWGAKSSPVVCAERDALGSHGPPMRGSMALEEL
jgi:hypothetical protein